MFHETAQEGFHQLYLDFRDVEVIASSTYLPLLNFRGACWCPSASLFVNGFHHGDSKISSQSASTPLELPSSDAVTQSLVPESSTSKMVVEEDASRQNPFNMYDVQPSGDMAANEFSLSSSKRPSSMDRNEVLQSTEVFNKAQMESVFNRQRPSKVRALKVHFKTSILTLPSSF